MLIVHVCNNQAPPEGYYTKLAERALWERLLVTRGTLKIVAASPDIKLIEQTSRLAAKCQVLDIYISW